MVNEESLKYLSAHLEALQQQRPHASSTPAALSFYVRQTTATNPTATPSTAAENSFKLIHIAIDRRQRDSKTIIRTLLQCCDLSTEFVDAIRSSSPTKGRHSDLSPQRRASRYQQQHQQRTRRSDDGGDAFYGSAYADERADAEADEQERIRKVKRERTLKLARVKR